MTASAKTPAATSSRTIPVPPGNFSSCRMGGGFTISNPRKSIKPASRVFHVSGTNRKVSHCPRTSSMTTNWGSFDPDACATRAAAGMPTAIAIPMRAARTGVWNGGGRARPAANQISAEASDPQVPGPGRSRPIPKKVAAKLAHTGALAAPVLLRLVTASVFVMGGRELRKFTLVGNVRDRGGHHVLPAGPLSEINQPATLTAERELLPRARDLPLASGTFQFEFGFAGHSSNCSRSGG